jgi:hypothetical protein
MRQRTAHTPAPRSSRILLAVLAAVAATAFPSPAAAEVLTVPSGSYSTIQSAIDAAVTRPGDDEVRLRGGTYVERLVVPATLAADSLRVSGGWDASFSRIEVDPTLTRVDARGTGRVLEARPTGSARLSFENLTLTGARVSGKGSLFGGGAQLNPTGNASVALVAVHVLDNIVEGDGSGFVGGAGLSAAVNGSAEVRVERCRVANNLARNPARDPQTTVFDSGLSIGLGEHGRFVLRDTLVENNVAETAGIVGAPGMGLETFDFSSAVVEDNRFLGNLARGASRIIAEQVELSARESGSVSARRNVIADDAGTPSTNDPDSQLRLFVGGEEGETPTLTLGDSIVAGRGGLYADARSPGATLRHTNLTVAVGLMTVLGNDAARTTVFNSIVWPGSLNTADTGVGTGRNLIGVDPLFVAPSRRDYRLRLTSPALDAGDDAPPGGLGPSDVDRRLRRSGARVDAGAHEAQSGLCRVDRLGELPGVAATTPVCTCLRDDVARNMLCGFFLPELFFEARIPLPFVPGAKLTAEWNIHPWTSGTAPYALAAQLLGKQSTLLPIDPPGHASGKLVPGKDVAVRVGLVTPESPAVLRLTLRHLPPGAAKPVDSVVEILVPQY